MGRLGWLFACGCMVASPWSPHAAAANDDSAVPARLSFAIAAQPLAPALIAYGGQANVQVLVSGELAASLRASPVQGQFAREEALDALLRGTSLTYRFIGATTVVIKPAAPLPPGHAEPPPVPITNLAPVHSVGLFANGYRTEFASGSARLDADPADLPQSVGVVTRDLMDARQDRTVPDALRTVAGVQYLDTDVGLPQFRIRGFRAGNGLTDGMPNAVVGVGDMPPLVAVERIEIPRGPQSILGDVSSSNNFGGLIGLVLKKPQATPVHRLTWALGSHGDTQLDGDFAGKLDGDGHWLYRAVFSVDRTDRSPQGYAGRRTNYIAPSLGWNGGDTQWIVGLSRMVNRFPMPDHVTWVDDTPSTATPRNLLLGNPQDHSQFRTTRYYYLFEHAFDDTWSLRSRAQYVHESSMQQAWWVFFPTVEPPAYAVADKYRYTDAYYTLQNELVAAFSLGVTHHTVMLGFDYSRARVGRYEDVQASVGDGSIDILGGERLPPVASLTSDQAMSPFGASKFTFSGDPWVTDSGLFLQDHMQLGEHWNALVAIRRSAYVLSTQHRDGSPWVRRKAQWVPNLGLVYKPVPGVALYASLSHGFQPDTVLGRNGKPLLPVLSRQLEAGAKFDLVQDKARLTVAWYRIALDRSTDLISSKPPYFGYRGPGQTNQGVEAEINGRLAPGLDVSASYTYARVHKHDGSLAQGAPRHRVDAWASYSFDPAARAGWGVGAGLHARSCANGLLSDGQTVFRNPGQYSLDANIFYRAPRWSVTLGVRNLLGRQLRAEDFDDSFVPLVERRSVLLSGSYDF
ncbi:TonB-dependent siderophore receptor [Dyella sp. 2RAB6]|uniref:TonB-dependent siderophore receptor n=1 Tax=Dyella sp. 2RAB6 TaxID=3232992 RepID=UPI003F92FE47